MMVFSICASQAIGQTLARQNWYFGSTTAGIRFNRGTNVAEVVNKGPIPFGNGGSAVATDPITANLLFYSDGSTVYDATHVPMPNGAGLLGNTASNQPIAVCAVPGQTNKYFLFTNNADFLADGTITRSVVDMALQGTAAPAFPALGDVEAANKNAVIAALNNNRSEGMILVPHANGTDFWLITHQKNSAIFSSTLVDATSFTAGTFTTTSTPPLGTAPAPVSVGNLSYNQTLNKLAVSVQTPTENSLILDFNATTGAITFDRYIPNSGVPGATTESIYDIQWDNGGQYLYLSRIGEAGIAADVLQYDYLNPAIPLASVLTTPIFRSFGLELAPDGSIYHIYQEVNAGPFLVGRFSNTSAIAAQVQQTPQPFGATVFDGKQFPSFLPQTNVNLTVSFTTGGSCQNNRISFFPTVTPNADRLVWDFGDGSQTSTDWSPVHTYATANASPGFSVSLTAFYQGQTRTVRQPVPINPFTLELQVVADTTACECELPINLVKCGGTFTPKAFEVTLTATGGTAPITFTWSNGDVGQTLTPDESGYYYVTAKDASGCERYAGVNVKQYNLNDQRSNFWYFGDRAGIDFNLPSSISPQPGDPPTPRAVTTSAMTAPAGCAIVCDRNGDVLFYTDGKNVFDKTNTPVPILPSGLAGDVLSSQSALIVPVPGDETLYYIFTTQQTPGAGTNEIRYSIFDLKQNNGKGLVTQQNALLFSKATERITANGQWIIAHEYGNSTFRAYEITANGIKAPVYSDIGSVHSFNSTQSGRGYMKLGPRDNLAVALSTGTENLVELFHFDQSSGRLDNYRKIVLPQATGQVYGVEFGAGGQKLFVSINGAPSNVFEYFLDAQGLLPPVLIPNPGLNVPVGLRLGAIQIAPDGQIYMAQENTTSLATISPNGGTISPFTPSTITLNSFDLQGRNSLLGLPNYVQQQGNQFSAPDFSPTVHCHGTPITFTGTPTDPIDEFLWDFGDGGTSTEKNSTQHNYAAPGTYTVKMRLTNRCGLDVTITKDVIIHPTPAKPTVDPSNNICTGPIELDANKNNEAGLTYRWSATGETTQKIQVNAAVASASVTSTNAAECSSTASFRVDDLRPPVDLGADQPICQNTTFAPLDAGAQTSYVWKLNDVANGNTSRTQPVATTTPGVFKYGVQVFVNVAGLVCTNEDDVTLTINVAPAAPTLAIISNPTCPLPGQNGIIRFTINNSIPASGPLYSYSFSSLASAIESVSDINAGFTKDFNGLGADSYNAVVQDQITGCQTRGSIALDDTSYDPSATVLPGCTPLAVSIESNAPAGVSIASYTINDITNATPPQTGVPSGNNFSVSLNGGSFTIKLKDNQGCTSTVTPDPITVVSNPGVPLVLNPPSVCTAPRTLEASGATTYQWTGPGIVGSSTSARIEINPSPLPGRFTYSVKGTTPGLCDITETVTLDVPLLVTADFDKTSECANQVTLTAKPNGNYTYFWTLNGAPQNNLGGPLVNVTQSGLYTVSLFDRTSGCTFTQNPGRQVDVVGALSVGLTSTPACDDNTPFTLTATSTLADVTYAWAHNTATITGQTDETLIDTRAGAYQVTATKATCSANATLEVVKLPTPKGVLEDGVTICNDPENKVLEISQVDLNPGEFESYKWFKDDAPLNVTTQVLTASSGGTYRVEITNSFRCKSSDQTVVTNECVPKITSPNAFRPDGAVSAINKEFFVYSFFITDKFEIAIFNRWGELVFSDTKRDFRWNGGYGNNTAQPAPSGTYSYVIKYQSSYRPEEGVKEQRGGIVLLR